MPHAAISSSACTVRMPKCLCLAQLVEDVGRRCDRVGAERDGQLGQLAGGDDAPRKGRVAGDARVLTGRQHGRAHLEAVADGLGRLAEVVAGDERGAVGRQHLLVGGEALLDPGDRLVGRAGVHPRHQPEGEEVLRTLGVAGLDAERAADLLGQRRHRHPDDPIALQAAVVERVDGAAVAVVVAGLLEVALVEGVLVDDQRAARLEAVEVGAQRGRVHRHEDVRLVAWRRDRVVGDLDLEAGDAVHGAGGCADLGRVLGQRRQVVAERGADGREAVAGELHAVARVAREAHHDAIERRGGPVVEALVGGSHCRVARVRPWLNSVGHSRQVGVVAVPLLFTTP